MAQKEVDQQRLWNDQHARRNSNGPEGTALRDVPTPGAVYLASLLRSPSRILEVGCANARDARSLASTGGHFVDCIDFSDVAIAQARNLITEQNLAHLVRPHCHNVSDGSLPPTLPCSAFYNAFFARSALTLNDEPLETLAGNITRRMASGGVILIEGRSTNDPKIQRSTICGNMADDNGHLRRVYTPENMTALAKKSGWQISEITEYEEPGFETVIHMLRFVAFCL